MKDFGRLLAWALLLVCTAGTLAYAADPTPTPPAPTDEKDNSMPQPGPGGPK